MNALVGEQKKKQGALLESRAFPAIRTGYCGYSYFLVPIFFVKLQPGKNRRLLFPDGLQAIRI